MTELVHNVLGAMWSFALMSALLTVMARWWLRRRLDRLRHPAEFDASAVYLALVVPGLMPAIWLASGLVHLELHGAAGLDHDPLVALLGARWHYLLLASGALVVVGAQLVSLWRRWRPSGHAHTPNSVGAASRRVDRMCREHSELAALAERVRVVDCGRHICATVGLLGQRVEIAASLVERLDDDALEAALLHEAAHFSLHDPTRSFLLLVSQIVNPFSWLMSTEVGAWRFAREVVCDAHAVACGAQPWSVAEAIVTAARAAVGARAAACAQLCGARTDAVTARINLLLSKERPEHRCTNPARVNLLGAAVIAATLLLPHLLMVRFWLV